MIHLLVRKHYKITSSTITIGILTLSFFSSLSLIVFFPKVAIFLMIPFVLFMFAQLSVMMILWQPKLIKKLANVDISKGSSISVKELSRLLSIPPHSTYAMMSMMERSGYLSFNYRYQGKWFNSSPRVGHHQIVLQFKN